MTHGNRILVSGALILLCAFSSNGQWARIAQPSASSDVNCLAAHGTTLFAGMAGDGLFSSTDNGDHWTGRNTGLAAKDVYSLIAASSPSGDQQLLIGTSGGVYFSTDEGANWQASAGWPGGAAQALASGPDGKICFAGPGWKGVYSSADGGENWSAANTGMAQEIVTALAILPGSAGSFTVLAGTGSGVFRSEDKGVTWTAANTGLPSPGITALIKVPNGAGGYSVFAGVANHGLFRSTDNAASWTEVGSGLFENVLALTTYSSIGVGPVIVCGSGFGKIFISSDNGTSWIDKSPGLPVKQITQGGLAVCGGYFYCGIFQSGIWRRPLSQLLAMDIQGVTPVQPALEQNYPNPFNPSTIISYSLPEAGDVSLVVTNVFGQNVRTLVEERKQAGTYEVTFDGSELPSGVYVYTMTANGKTLSRKMTQMK
jgi:hypothetical protein